MRLIDGDELWDKAYEVWGIEADAGDASLFMGMITDCPTIDPVKHGRWIGEEVEIFGSLSRECSRCHKVRAVDHYCSNCGAFMMEEHNGDK